MTSVLNVDSIAAKDGTSPVELTKQVAAKAWAKYGMDDNTINDSFNLASLTDNGTGDFTQTWSNGFDSIYYSQFASVSIGNGLSAISKQDFYIPTTSSVRLYAAYHNGSSETGGGTAYDYAVVSLLAHGDLA